MLRRSSAKDRERLASDRGFPSARHEFVHKLIRGLLMTPPIFVGLFLSWPAMKSLIQSITISVQKTPQPAGPYAVNRREIEIGDGIVEQGRPVAIRIDLWEPAGPSTVAPHMAKDLVSAIARRHGRVDVESDGVFPLLIYVPGWGGRRDDNQHLLRQLVSFGYVVAAIDDVGRDPEAARNYGDFDLTSRAALARSQQAVDRRLAVMLGRISAVTAYLTAQQPAVDGRKSARIDPGRIGFLGFSFGGSIGAEASLIEPRLKAIANMDGWHFGRAATRGVAKPYLVFNSDTQDLARDLASSSVPKRLAAELTIADRALQRRMEAEMATTALLFSQTTHGDFTDALFTPSLIAYVRHWRRDGDARIRLHASIASHLLRFFDRHLLGTVSEAEGKEELRGLWPVIPVAEAAGPRSLLP